MSTLLILTACQGSSEADNVPPSDQPDSAESSWDSGHDQADVDAAPEVDAAREANEADTVDVEVAATCSDGDLNGSESDIDCGGDCEPCSTGEVCYDDADCESGVCAEQTCAAPTCSDSVTNGAETDVDCGGSCEPCDENQGCVQGSDCGTGVCVAGKCAGATCLDGVANGSETDVDCGGECPGCSAGLVCNLNADCASAICGSGGLCLAASCSDEVKNGAESDIDRGGSCDPCVVGAACSDGADCEHLVCVSNVCVDATCNDGVSNGSETDEDCGGNCDPCKDGKHCVDPSDCASLVCSVGICAVPSCSDGVVNGTESDVDCGGNCSDCGTGAACSQGSDCASGVCSASFCAAASCTDGVWNSAETDVDCGGPSCAGCSLAAACVEATDCASVHCLQGRCEMGEYGLGVPIYEVGVGQFTFAADDFDGDGLVDVLSANRDDTLGWLRGMGDGTFAPAELITLYPELSSIRSADLNEDGIADAIVSSRLGAVSVLRGSPSGPTSAVDYQADFATATAVGDVDGDGHIDVMFDDEATKTVSLLVNDGTGNLSDGGTFDLHPSAGAPTWRVVCMELADVDNDGDADLLFSHDQGGFFLMRNLGGGQFGEPEPTSSVSMLFVLADMNEDSNLDLVGGGFSSLLVQLGDGTGAFHQHFSVASVATSLGIAAGDYDGDGHIDIAVNHEHSSSRPMSGVTILKGMGDGTLFESQDLRAGNHPVGVVAADLQADGLVDLLVNNNGTWWDWDNHRFGVNLGVYVSGPGGVFPTFPVHDVGSGHMQVEVGDLDLDGDDDAIVARWGDSGVDGGLTVLVGAGDTLLIGEQYTPGGMVSSATIGDLTGDGLPDLFSTDPGAQQLHLFEGAGNGTFGAPTTLGGAGIAIDGALVDIDGDGRLDLAWAVRAGTGLVGTRKNLGGSVFGAVQWWGASANDVETLEAGDLTGDGRPDFVVTKYGDEYGIGSQLVVLRNQGGTFSSTTTYDVAWGAIGAALADFDGDGLLDVAVAHGETSHVGIMRNKGGGMMAPEVFYAVHPRTNDIASADLNGDGRPDLALVHWSSGSASILINEGGTFAPARHFLVGEKPTSIATALVDEDSTYDLLVAIDRGLGQITGRIR